MSDLWRELLENRKFRDQLDNSAPNNSSEAEQLQHEERLQSHSKRNWFYLIISFGLIMAMLSVSIYMPYLKRRKMLVELNAKGNVLVTSDVPEWFNELNIVNLNEYFPRLMSVHLEHSEVPDYMLDFLIQEQGISHLTFYNCTFENPLKPQQISRMKELKHLTIVGCEGLQYDLVDQLLAVNPSLNLIFRGKAYIGVMVNDFKAVSRLSHVAIGSPADIAGLHVGDVITRLAEENVENFEKLVRIIADHKAGDTINLVYERDHIEHLTRVTLAERPIDR